MQAFLLANEPAWHSLRPHLYVSGYLTDLNELCCGYTFCSQDGARNPVDQQLYKAVLIRIRKRSMEVRISYIRIFLAYKQAIRMRSCIHIDVT